MSKPGLIMLMDGRAPMPRREIQKRKGGKKKITLEKQKIRQISREEKKKWHGPKDCLLALFPLRV